MFFVSLRRINCRFQNCLLRGRSGGRGRWDKCVGRASLPRRTNSWHEAGGSRAFELPLHRVHLFPHIEDDLNAREVCAGSRVRIGSPQGVPGRYLQKACCPGPRGLEPLSSSSEASADVSIHLRHGTYCVCLDTLLHNQSRKLKVQEVLVSCTFQYLGSPFEIRCQTSSSSCSFDQFSKHSRIRADFDSLAKSFAPKRPRLPIPARFARLPRLRF